MQRSTLDLELLTLFVPVPVHPVGRMLRALCSVRVQCSAGLCLPTRPGRAGGKEEEKRSAGEKGEGSEGRTELRVTSLHGHRERREGAYHGLRFFKANKPKLRAQKNSFKPNSLVVRSYS